MSNVSHDVTLGAATATILFRQTLNSPRKTTQMLLRPRRNRKSAAIRNLVRETHLPVTKLIYPLFVVDGPQRREAIGAMPGQFRLGQDEVAKEVALCLEMGIESFVLFPAVDDSLKDKIASHSWASDNFYLTLTRDLKERFPQACFMSDVAMDPYSSDGHDGLVRDGKIVNDETLPILARMAVAQSEAGFDIIGPSDMMDGRVAELRMAMDQAGHTETSIMSYTAKYASAFYGPFREALDSAPRGGDKKTYQMDPANAVEALREAELDAAEGADILMVKPALCYLDVIRALKDSQVLPISAYNVSGEYAMVHAASQNGWLDYTAAMQEMLLSIHRSGADIILTYFAKDYAQLLRS